MPFPEVGPIARSDDPRPDAPQRRRRSPLSSRLLVVLLVVALAGATWWLAGLGRPGAEARVPRAATGAAAFGIHHDWTLQTAAGFADELGATPVYFGRFVGFPFTPAELAALDEAAEQVRDVGSVLLLTLEPHGGLATVTDAALAELSGWLERWNDAGLSVIVRFAHEMNGGWYPWGQQPGDFVATFRRVAAAVRQAPASEILWAPNEGGGYPFPGGAYNAVAGDEGFDALDTDGDDALTQSDDPYGPYYPGDGHIDWVGLTVYHFGARWPWGDNVLPEAGVFLDKIRGSYDGTAGDQRAVPDFHARYAAGRGKPLMIAETSALYNRDRDAPPGGEVALKGAWLGQVLADDLQDELPALRGIVWFAVDKPEEEIGGDFVAWGLTHDRSVLEAFRAASPRWLRFREDPPWSR